MNANELEANPVLSSFALRDLNEQPSLQSIDNITDASLDAVVCSVSIDYLNQPRAVMGEIARVSLSVEPHTHNFPENQGQT